MEWKRGVAAIAIALVLVFGVVMWPFKNYSIVETKLFEGDGFSFEYPVFKNWQVKEVSHNQENEWVIALDYPSTLEMLVPPSIQITKQPLQIDTPIGGPESPKTNPHGVTYDPHSFIFFGTTADGITVLISNIPPFEKDGFSKKAFVETVSETFRFVIADRIKKKGAFPLSVSHASAFVKNGVSEPDATAALAKTISELKNDGENPSEFYFTLAQNDTMQVEIQLWHETAFSDENFIKIGNPSGKERTFKYDIEKNQVVSKEFWQ
jgi:hypothetical protein